jgi:hypothetical protein
VTIARPETWFNPRAATRLHWDHSGDTRRTGPSSQSRFRLTLACCAGLRRRQGNQRKTTVDVEVPSVGLHPRSPCHACQTSANVRSSTCTFRPSRCGCSCDRALRSGSRRGRQRRQSGGPEAVCPPVPWSEHPQTLAPALQVQVCERSTQPSNPTPQHASRVQQPQASTGPVLEPQPTSARRAVGNAPAPTLFTTTGLVQCAHKSRRASILSLDSSSIRVQIRSCHREARPEAPRGASAAPACPEYSRGGPRGEDVLSLVKYQHVTNLGIACGRPF